MRQVGRSVPGRRTVGAKALRREAKADTVDVKTPCPREQPNAWPSGSSFSSGTDAPALHLSLDKQSPGGPAGSPEASTAFVSGLWAWGGHRAQRG